MLNVAYLLCGCVWVSVFLCWICLSLVLICKFLLIGLLGISIFGDCVPLRYYLNIYFGLGFVVWVAASGLVAFVFPFSGSFSWLG